MPGIGARFDRVSHPRLNGLRSSQVTGFKNYIIYYLPKPDGIELIRVLHAARDAKTILETEEGP
jgi:toxin ParE1/3/4